MKQNYFFTFLFFIVVVATSFSQVQTSGNWNANGTTLTNVTTDADNGDGNGDGGIYIKSLSTATDQGANFTFNGTMTLNESISISTFNYNTRVSYVRFNVQLYNLTDGVVLATTSPYISIVGLAQQINGSGSKESVLSYNAALTDVGDILQVRYVRATPYETYREFAIDNLKLNGTFVSTSLSTITTCPFTLTPDLPLIASSTAIENEINLAVSRFSDAYLGTSAPTTSELSSAESSYAALNITVTNGQISGNTISKFSSVPFLRVFAKHLKFNPGDANIKEKANNTVWLVSKQFCDGTLARDMQKYAYEDFARPSSLLKDFLEPEVKDLFGYTLYVHTNDYLHYWSPTFNETDQLNDAIDTDLIYNLSDVMMTYCTWQNTQDERYRYMRGFKRFLERFFTYSVGTTNGIKVDGSGFHHWTAYNNYMYSYKTAAELLGYLSGTNFQVAPENYQVFRNAVYFQYMEANDDGVQALSTTGRKPEARTHSFNAASLKTMAIEGGAILGLATADPVLAGLYNRVYGVEPTFNYSTVTPFETGFFQFNHASAGAFRKNNWVAFNKGFSNNMWGTETYPTANRYGRYQSYGALEIIYPGNISSGNGYNVNTWDWNFNPGTTVIKLPWANLHAERERIDELQQKRFVGALSLQKKNSELLQNNHGDYGLFAMDFQELEGQGFSTIYSSENHNASFTFKKSSFYFDDMIVCLGSGISNNDTSNPTITTLFQRLDNKSGVGVTVNGSSQSSIGEVTYTGEANNWMLSNYGTGFYLVNGNDELKVKKEVQQNPNHNQIWPVNYSSNAAEVYYTGYINHGTNPSDDSYEYMILPSSSTSELQDLNTAVSGGSKPYIVHQKDANAHIVEYISKEIFGYALFGNVSGLTYDKVKAVNASCLLMTKYDAPSKTLKMSIVDPDLGFTSRSYVSSVSTTKEVTVDGEWSLDQAYLGVQILSSSATETIISVELVDGLSKEFNLIGVETLGIDNEDLVGISIYPNPTHERVIIASKEEISKIEIYNLLGEVLSIRKENSFDGVAVNVSYLPNGVYFLKVYLGKTSKTLKFIKN